MTYFCNYSVKFVELTRTFVSIYVLPHSCEILSQTVDNVYNFVYNSQTLINTAFFMWISLWLKNSLFDKKHQILCRFYKPLKISTFSDNS